MTSQVDHVVIGAGWAGCAVAARLAERADARVVVLEAGGPDTLEAIHQPPMCPALWGTEVDWAYETTPQAHNGGLVHQWPRGKVLGGSSSLNGMVYLRGNPADYDDWAYHGCKGWDYDALLPLFRRMEDVPDGDPHYRGRGGPNTPRPARDPNPICAAFVEAARQKGHPVTDDHNGAQFEGAGYHDMIISGGRRQSAADAYLHPAAGRPNLEIVTGARALGLLFDGDRCAGVRYARDGEVIELRVAGEVVVCAGAVDSPALLLRSGIGPADELRGARRPRGRRRAGRRAQPPRPPADGRVLGGCAGSPAARVQHVRGVDVHAQRPAPARPRPALHVHPRAVPPADLHGAGGLVDDRGRTRAPGEPRRL